jgi:hypothetical protein
LASAGEQQRLVSGSGGPLHDVAAHRTLLHHVKLHPEPAARAFSDLLESCRRQGAQRIRNAGPDSRSRQREVSVAAQQAVEAGGRNDQGRLGGAAEYRAALVAGGCVDERRRHETQSRERLAVAAQRHLVLGPALDVLEYESGNAPPGNLAQVGDVERTRNAAAAEGAPFPGHVRACVR